LRGRVVTARGVLDRAEVVFAGERILDVRPVSGRVPDRWILPGFVDIHVHGARGAHFLHASPKKIQEILAAHTACGTTACLPTLEAASVDSWRKSARSLADFTEQPPQGVARMLGIHLEGPFLNPKQAGAQEKKYLRKPSIAWLARLVEDLPIPVRIMTLAPELSGSLEVIEKLAGAGIVPSIGHTQATAHQVSAALACGAQSFTHAFNAMRPMGHRELGAAGAVLCQSDVWAEIIADGLHLAPAFLEHWFRTRGARKTILITDATLGMGAQDGKYQAFGQKLTIADGCAALPDGTLAGSTLTMDAAVRMVVLNAGVSLLDASRMASLHPARLLGLDRKIGSIARGKEASFVVMNRKLEVRETWVCGCKHDP